MVEALLAERAAPDQPIEGVPGLLELWARLTDDDRRLIGSLQFDLRGRAEFLRHCGGVSEIRLVHGYFKCCFTIRPCRFPAAEVNTRPTDLRQLYGIPVRP